MSTDYIAYPPHRLEKTQAILKSECSPKPPGKRHDFASMRHFVGSAFDAFRFVGILQKCLNYLTATYLM
ncbi:MAG: hypothetical protein KBE23_18285 [Chloroflexi bacterium]|nr:hypothetical protein [Chloroflexota bacterium]MBP7044709.1 hypothetical protein [Chloroflexota bacterium]